MCIQTFKRWLTLSTDEPAHFTMSLHDSPGLTTGLRLRDNPEVDANGSIQSILPEKTWAIGLGRQMGLEQT